MYVYVDTKIFFDILYVQLYNTRSSNVDFMPTGKPTRIHFLQQSVEYIVINTCSTNLLFFEYNDVELMITRWNT